MNKYEINIPPTMIDPDGSNYKGQFKGYASSNSGGQASGEGAGDVLIITANGGTKTSNYTYEEAKAKFLSGKITRAVLLTNINDEYSATVQDLNVRHRSPDDGMSFQFEFWYDDYWLGTSSLSVYYFTWNESGFGESYDKNINMS